MTTPDRVEPGPGHESVWDYPRPPRLEDFDGHIQIVLGGVTIADTRAAKRVLETSHPPVYYLPPEDIRMEYLRPVERTSWCEWKGQARYYDVRVGDVVAEAAAWAYPDPATPFEALKDHVAFYPEPMDACLVNGERVTPQPGGFYGGWITSNIVGPFKGTPGTGFW
jgi:uncharacterized protein (DUF427 family)